MIIIGSKIRKTLIKLNLFLNKDQAKYNTKTARITSTRYERMVRININPKYINKIFFQVILFLKKSIHP